MSQDFFSAIKATKKKQLSTLADPKGLSKVNEFISTGCLPLDLILGGGIPVGRATEIYGDTSTGKSLLAAHILAETQKVNGIAVLLDTETATSDEIFKAVGVDANKCIYAIPETVEQVYAVIEECVKLKDDLAKKDEMTIVWDSVASTSSQAEVDKILKEGLGGATMATHARLISTMCRILPTMVASRRIAMVFINQTRQNIGVMFGDKMSTFGGRAIGYYSSVRLEMAKVRNIEDDNDVITGIEARCYVAKSKVAPPFGKCRIAIKFGVGFDIPTTVLYYLKDNAVVEATGGWLAIKGIEGLKFHTRDFDKVYASNQAKIDALMLRIAGYEVEV